VDSLGPDRDDSYRYVYRWLWWQDLLIGAAVYVAAIVMALLVSGLGFLVSFPLGLEWPGWGFLWRGLASLSIGGALILAVAFAVVFRRRRRAVPDGLVLAMGESGIHLGMRVKVHIPWHCVERIENILHDSTHLVVRLRAYEDSPSGVTANRVVLRLPWAMVNDKWEEIRGWVERLAPHVKIVPVDEYLVPVEAERFPS
jgi:hypothetical protein